MKTLTFILSVITLLPSTLLAQTFADRVRETYLSTDQNYDLECNYAYNKVMRRIVPVNETTKTDNKISRDFTIEGIDHKMPMNFSLVRKDRSVFYNVLINNTHLSSAKLGRREFYLAPLKDRDFQNKYETSQIYCYVKFANAASVELTDENYHINVHPHTIYDWQHRLKTPVEAYLNNPAYKSMLLLESTNYRTDLVDINKFFDGTPYILPYQGFTSDLEFVPNEVPLIVSPAGKNEFHITAKKEVNITYTGGNHNYCVWNNSRRVLEALMYSNSTAKINFIYQTEALIVQASGMEGLGLNFSKNDVNRSNLLKDLLVDPNIQKKYHAGYIWYFKNTLATEYKAMFKTFTINYKAEGFNTSVTVQGNGDRELEANFIYQ